MKHKQLTHKEIKKEKETKLANKNTISLLLDRVSNIANLGIIFRSADAIKIKHIYLYQPQLDVKSKKLIKTSRSTINCLSWSELDDIQQVIRENKTAHFTALEKTSHSIAIKKYRPKGDIILIVGSETYGISEELLALAHDSIHLPMLGKNTSINLAAATTAAIFMISEKIENKFC